MSNSQKMTKGASSTEESQRDRKTPGQSARFTPLRSYVTRARALSREARGANDLANDLALSRLISVPRLQS